MRVLLVPNYYKDEAVESARSIEAWLDDRGIEAVWAPDQRLAGAFPADPDGAGLIVSLGGDGTLLRAARIAGYREIPILGLSYGHLGFLTAASPEERDVLQVVGQALAGELHVSRRATLASRMSWADGAGRSGDEEAFALNDVALTRSSLGEMIEFDMSVSGHAVDRLRGDGVVVSSATGSTGYALSAGGPIVSPEFRGMVCVPIAPHTIQARAFLTSSSDVVELELSRDRPASAAVFVDGQPMRLPGELRSVEVRRGPGDVLLLDYGPESFYNSVSRVFYGDRPYAGGRKAGGRRDR